MTGTHATFQLAALAAAFFGIIGACVCCIVYPCIRNRLALLTPTTCARTLLAWAMAPFIIATALTALCILPSALNLLGWFADHCLQQAQHRSHFCLPHPHLFLGSTSGWLLLAISGGLGFVAAVYQLYGWLRTCRIISALTAASHYDGVRRVYRVETRLPLALTAGLWRPQIYISSYLAASLPRDMLDVVIAHERAHVCRHDGLIQLLASLFALMHLPRIRRRLLADLALTCDKACDEEAARHTGNRLRVAHTLLVVERLFNGVFPKPAAGIASIDSGSVVERVESLLMTELNSEPRRNVPRYLRVMLVAAILSTAVWSAEPLHHLIEALLGFLAR
jgi:Antirepressor regulating drug resistance, predicted signal transduction N-terminal membrane component